jgi:hypothetical protein
MKQRILGLFLPIVATAVLTACSSSESSIEYDIVKVDRHVAITKAQDAPCCDVHLELACAKKTEGERAKAINDAVTRWLFDMEGISMQQAADSFANKYTRDYQKNFAPLYREDAGDPEKRAWYEYHYNINGEMASGRDGITVYTASIDYYEGGAHGINQRLTMNFDNKDGKALTLNDVFSTGFEYSLNELLLEKLIEKAGAKDVDELRQMGYLYAMDIFAPENFILGQDNVTFVYNPYEIASYEKGLIELTIDNDELKDLWKK